jgi:hypothetical protein
LPNIRVASSGASFSTWCLHGVPLGFVFIGQYNNPVPFQATGVDRGILTDVFFSGSGVLFE